MLIYLIIFTILFLYVWFFGRLSYEEIFFGVWGGGYLEFIIRRDFRRLLIFRKVGLF